MKKIFVFVILIMFLYGCVKDKPVKTAESVVELSNDQKVFVLNEGNYGSSQASLSLYDPTTQAVVEDFYRSQNNEGAGDVIQSLSYHNGNYYLVVNNSGKIIVCDKQMKKKALISGLNSPRYFLPVSNSKAYVSDLSLNAISVVDLNANVKSAQISCPGWTEKMVMIYNKAFVTNLRRNYIYVINTVTDKISDSIAVGINAGNVILDKQDKIWVLSAGDQPGNIPAKLSRIDPVSGTVELSLVFPKTESPGSLCLNKTKDTLFFISNGVFRLPISSQVLPTSPFVPSNGRNYYGLGVDPDRYTLYAADVLDYVQRSNIYLFDMKGNQLSFFKAGIISNGFYFE